MNEYPTELLVLPSPFIAIVSDSPSAERLTAALRATNAGARTLPWLASVAPHGWPAALSRAPRQLHYFHML